MGESVENRGRKYTLLTEELYKNLRNANRRAEQTQSAEFSQILALDDKIKDILSSQLPDTMKARMYGEAASEYFNLRERAPETSSNRYRSEMSQREQVPPPPPPPPPPDRKPQTVETEPPHVPQKEAASSQYERQEDEDDIFEDAPAAVVGPSKLPSPQVSKDQKVQDERIGKIMDFISQHTDVVNYDPQTSNVQIYGKNWAKSDINDILTYITRKRVSKTEVPPHGTGQFVVALGRAGIDAKLLPRKELRELLSQQKGMGGGSGWISLYEYKRRVRPYLSRKNG